MTSLPERPNTALLVVDMQNDVVAKAHRRDEVIANIDNLVGRARAESVPVIWVQHASDHLKLNSDGWQYVPGLKRREPELLVHKRYGDSFEDTLLEPELARLGVGRVIVTGAQSDACIRSTIHGAFARGYDTVLVADAHTTEDLSAFGAPPPDQVIAHTNMYWSWQAAPGLRILEGLRRIDRFAVGDVQGWEEDRAVDDVVHIRVHAVFENKRQLFCDERVRQRAGE